VSIGKKVIIILVILSFIGFGVWAQDLKLKSQYRFVMITKVVHPWFDSVYVGADAAAKYLTKLTGKKVVVELRAPANADVVIQNEMIEKAIATRPDGIFIDLLDPVSNLKILSEAKKMGIQVLLFDCEYPGWPSLGTDYSAEGALIAEELAKDLGYKGKVALSIGVPTAANHHARHLAAKAVIEKYPNMSLVAEVVDNDSIEEAAKQAAAAITANPDLAGFIGLNAAAPIGIGIAIKEAGKVGKIKFIGMDALPEMVQQVKDGIASRAITLPVRQIGFWSVLSLFTVVTGAPFDVKLLPHYETGAFFYNAKDADKIHNLE
jgi:ribose transport system substrate-binding protein